MGRSTPSSSRRPESPDAALPGQAVGLADHLATVVEHLRDAEVRVGERGRVGEDEIVPPPFDTVTEYVDTTIRDGVESRDLRDYLDRMGFDVDGFDPVAHGFDGTDRLDAEEARRLRLEDAERLERDVQRTNSVGGG